MTTEAQALRCVTHHYACDCREYRHEQEVAHLKRLLQRATETAYWRSSPEALRLYEEIRSTLEQLDDELDR
jgi:hypothetical protein